MHKQTGALSYFKSWEINKDDSITFDWKGAQKDKGLNELLNLMSQKYQMTTLDDIAKKDY